MTNYFCFVCQRYFLSESILKDHAKYAGHSLHDIGMTLFFSSIPSGIKQCVCGEMFKTTYLMEQHIEQKKCYSNNAKEQKCVCGGTEFKVFMKDGKPYYQCVNCEKRTSFEAQRELHNVTHDIEMISNDSENNSDNKQEKTIDSKTQLLKLLETPASTLEFAKTAGLLNPTPACEVCGKQMSLCKQSDKSDGYYYSCYKYGFQKHIFIFSLFII